jgi:hypothetical protein
MNKRILLLSIIVLISLVGLSITFIQKNAILEKEILRERIAHEVIKFRYGSIEIIDLEKTTSFDWDKLYIFGPYTTAKKMNEELGQVWILGYFTHIDSSENYSLLVFMNKNRIVQFLEFPRSLVDFSPLEQVNGYSNLESRFIIDEDGRLLVHE